MLFEPLVVSYLLIFCWPKQVTEPNPKSGCPYSIHGTDGDRKRVFLSDTLIYHVRGGREKKKSRERTSNFFPGLCSMIFLPLLNFPSPSKGAVDLVVVTGVSGLDGTGSKAWLLRRIQIGVSDDEGKTHLTGDVSFEP